MVLIVFVQFIQQHVSCNEVIVKIISHKNLASYLSALMHYCRSLGGELLPSVSNDSESSFGLSSGVCTGFLPQARDNCLHSFEANLYCTDSSILVDNYSYGSYMCII